MNIYKQVLGLTLLVASMNAQSAISPTMMNLRDSKIMAEFIEQHQKVASPLERIDFISYTVIFNKACEAYLVRPKASIFLFSGPRPQALIEFQSSSCTLTNDNKVKE